MKFENEFIRIVIEKKELPEGRRQELKIKMKKRLPYAIVALVLVAALSIGIWGSTYGSGNHKNQDVNEELVSGNPNHEPEDELTEVVNDSEEDEKPEGTYVTAAHLASGVQSRYDAGSLYGYSYGEPIKDLGRNEPIQIEIGYDAKGLNLEHWTEIFAFYQDPELKYPISVSYEYNDNKIIMNPHAGGMCTISTIFLDTDIVNKYEHSQYHFFDKGDGNDWGNLGTFYMASYRDKETGELLEMPEVSIITRKGELEDSLSLRFSIADDGRALLRWNEVEGAQEYMICKLISNEKSGYEKGMQVICVTSGTSWMAEAPVFDDSFTYTNKEFKYFKLSEDDWKSGWNSYKDRAEEGQAWRDAGDGAYSICVIAVCSEGTSMISNVYSYEDLAANLPYSIAYYTAKENGMERKYEKIEDVSAYSYVTMCDGATSAKLIDYKTEEASVSVAKYGLMDENEEIIGIEAIPVLLIPYTIEGTPFSYITEIIDYDETNKEKDLQFLEEREDKLRKKSGDIPPKANMRMAAVDLSEPSDKEIRQVEDVTVFANSALSEYLAISMLGGATVIDLSEFAEAADVEFVYDALMEAYYQNPLILGMSGYRINQKGTAIRVVYDETQVQQANKQEELKAVIPQIVSDIIQADMTDLEKELAINQYLCDTIEYDYDALENAEKNEFMYVDEEFNDSFTAYGALINGKCVCAGYSAAFKLLADEAGLESIVVTGFLEGSLAHAWNKVKIEGEWQIVDSTNNDNEYLFNALFNLPAEGGEHVLVEDNDYVLDNTISEYVGKTEDYEYYHLTDSYFSRQEIAKELAAQLNESGTALLRTDYTLNDYQFYDIADSIYDIMGDETELYGYYWLGVIYLTTD